MASNNLTLQLISYADIIQQPLPDIPWRVEGVMSEGERVVVYGEWGSYKTWFLLYLAIHLAAGRPWFGHYAIDRPHNVLFFDEEMSEWALRRRIKQLSLGFDPPLPEDLPLKLVNRSGTRFPNRECAHQILREVADCEFAPDVIILETLRRFMVGDENQARDVGEFWARTSPLIEDGRTLVVSHHMKKRSFQGNESTRDRAIGSTDIMAAVDSAFSLNRQKGDTSIRVVHEKSRADEAIKPFAFRLHSTKDPESISLQWVGNDSSFIQESNPQEHILDQLEQWLSDRSGETIQSSEVIAWFGEKDIPERTAQRMWAGYRKAHHLTSSKQGFYDIPNKPAA